MQPSQLDQILGLEIQRRRLEKAGLKSIWQK